MCINLLRVLSTVFCGTSLEMADIDSLSSDSDDEEYIPDGKDF